MGESIDDPVFHDHTTNTWWFWDETWEKTIGPFMSELESRAAYMEYCRTLSVD